MTVSQRFYLPINQLFTSLGEMAAGWKLYTYATGTTTPKVTYNSPDLNVANPNPIILDSSGRTQQPMFVQKSSQYKLVVTDQNDVPVPYMTYDPVDSFAVSLNDFDPRPASYWGTTTGTASAYLLAANPTMINYSANDIFLVTFHTSCNSSPTLDIDGKGALNLKKYSGLGTVALAAGDVTDRHWVTNDGTENLIVLNPSFKPVIYSGAPATLTIASDAITITNMVSSYLIDTEAAAPTDNLVTINGGVDGVIIIVQIVNNARVVTIKNSGNIITSNALDLVLDDTRYQAVFKYRASDAKWVQVGYPKLQSFSAPVNLLFGTVYYAEYDTVVHVYNIYLQATDTDITLLADNNPSPTTLRIKCNTGLRDSAAQVAMTGIVRKGEYYMLIGAPSTAFKMELK